MDNLSLNETICKLKEKNAALECEVSTSKHILKSLCANLQDIHLYNRQEIHTTFPDTYHVISFPVFLLLEESFRPRIDNIVRVRVFYDTHHGLASAAEYEKLRAEYFANTIIIGVRMITIDLSDLKPGEPIPPANQYRLYDSRNQFIESYDPVGKWTHIRLDRLAAFWSKVV